MGRESAVLLPPLNTSSLQSTSRYAQSCGRAGNYSAALKLSLQELGVDEVLERAGALSRNDGFPPLVGH